MHRFSHFITRMWRGTFENFRIVVIQPLDPLIAVERFDPGAHPATKIAVAVCINLDLSSTCHRHFLSLGVHSGSQESLGHKLE